MRTTPGPIEAILFDKDGTLVDYAATWLPINRAAADLAAAGDPALARRLLAVGGYDSATGRVAGGSLLAAAHTREIAAAWIAEGAPYERDALVAALDRVFAGGAAEAVPVGDVAALFARLRARGLRLGVATSDSEAAARATLARLGVPAGSVFVAGYDSGHGVKPTPGMVRGFCAHAGVEAARLAVVGDNLHDLDMAHAAGCGLAVGVLTGTGAAGELGARAHRVIDSIADLEDLLAREGLLPSGGGAGGAGG